MAVGSGAVRYASIGQVARKTLVILTTTMMSISNSEDSWRNTESLLAEKSSVLSRTAAETLVGTPEHNQASRPVDVPRAHGMKREWEHSPPQGSKRRRKSRTTYTNQPPVQVNVYGTMPPYADPDG